MRFVRYEIRIYGYNLDMDGGMFEDFTYIPFNTLNEAINYTLENDVYSDTTMDVYVCRVTLYPTHDSCERLFRVEERCD